MQEVFAAFAHRIGIEGSDMIRFLDKIALDKNVSKAKKTYTKNDIDTIFNLIEEDNSQESWYIYHIHQEKIMSIEEIKAAVKNYAWR